MTPDEYFNEHIPHRVNLLTTFRDRYTNNPRRPGFLFGEPRDLFRCSKDISLLMIRFFCGEMGLYLPRRGKGKKGGTELEEVLGWIFPFGVQQFTESQARNDVRYPSLLIAMKAANRAVAHIESLDVDHPIKTEKDHQILFDSIGWIEELIGSHVYRPNGRQLSDAMALPNNVM
jgi:hypothetical protein